jgi:hypothetical protein
MLIVQTFGRQLLLPLGMLKFSYVGRKYEIVNIKYEIINSV